MKGDSRSLDYRSYNSIQKLKDDLFNRSGVEARVRASGSHLFLKASSPETSRKVSVVSRNRILQEGPWLCQLTGLERSAQNVWKPFQLCTWQGDRYRYWHASEQLKPQIQVDSRLLL